jgi:hypothetical protein
VGHSNAKDANRKRGLNLIGETSNGPQLSFVISLLKPPVLEKGSKRMDTGLGYLVPVG